jgi:hypothetical protein
MLDKSVPLNFMRPGRNVVLRRDGEKWELEIRELDDDMVIRIAKALKATRLRNP